MSNYAVFNPKTNSYSTVVTGNTGKLPDGYQFVPVDELPKDAVREVTEPTPDEVLESKVQSGYKDEIGRIFPTDAAGQTAMNSAATVALVREKVGSVKLSVTLYDIDGSAVTLSIDEALQVFVRYFDYCAGLRKEKL